MVQSTLSTLALISQLAAGYTATKYVAEFRSKDPERTGGILGMLVVFSASAAVIVSLILLIASGWLAGSVLKAPALGTALTIGSGVLLFAVLNGLLMGALAGLESYRALARALVWGGGAYLVVCTGLAWWRGLDGAVWGLTLSGLFQFILLTVALLKECSLQGIKIRYSGDEARTAHTSEIRAARRSERLYLNAGVVARERLPRSPAEWLFPNGPLQRSLRPNVRCSVLARHHEQRWNVLN